MHSVAIAHAPQTPHAPNTMIGKPLGRPQVCFAPPSLNAGNTTLHALLAIQYLLQVRFPHAQPSDMIPPLGPPLL